MSSFVKCFDAVTMVTDEATSQFAPMWRENKESKRILEQYCRAIDALSGEFGGMSFEVEADDIKMTITIKLECSDMTIKAQKYKYYELAQRALSFGFSVSESGNLVAQFVFPGIWEKNVQR